MSKNKKETKRAKEKRLREEAEEQQQRRQEQVKAGTQDLHREVKSVENARSRKEAKGNKRKGGQANTNEEAHKEEHSIVGNTNKETAPKTYPTTRRFYGNDEMKVMKHGRNKETGKLGVLFRNGGGPKHGGSDKWIDLDGIWLPDHILSYVPAWRDYCKKKNFPVDWGRPADGDDHQLGDDLEQDQDGDNLEDNSEAVCTGHKLDKKGGVYMILDWKDVEEPSYSSVKEIMASGLERKHFGPTWFAYCKEHGYLDDLFRVEGISVVQSIKAHEWGDCGRPIAEIKWKHGEVTKVLVKDAMEKSTDNNGFIAAWNEYCNKIDNVTDSFRKGHVDAEHKQKTKRKRKRH